MTKRTEAAADAAAVSRSDAPETALTPDIVAQAASDRVASDSDQKGAPPPPAGTDHDGDGRMGGSAPVPEIQHLVVIAADEARGLQLGDVVGASDALARELLRGDIARPATETEVELAQPRVRILKEA